MTHAQSFKRCPSCIAVIPARSTACEACLRKRREQAVYLAVRVEHAPSKEPTRRKPVFSAATRNALLDSLFNAAPEPKFHVPVRYDNRERPRPLVRAALPGESAPRDPKQAEICRVIERDEERAKLWQELVGKEGIARLEAEEKQRAARELSERLAAWWPSSDRSTFFGVDRGFEDRAIVAVQTKSGTLQLIEDPRVPRNEVRMVPQKDVTGMTVQELMRIARAPVEEERRQADHRKRETEELARYCASGEYLRNLQRRLGWR